MGLGGGSEAEKVLWAENLSLLCHFPTAPRPHHVTKTGRNFVNGAERWVQGEGEAPPPSPKRPISLAGCRGVSNKQQWAGNRRHVIGCGENPRGAWARSSAPSCYPGYPSGSSRREGLWTVAQIRATAIPECWAVRLPPDCTLGKYPRASPCRFPARLRPTCPPAGVNVRFLLKILLGARLRTG